MTTKILCGKDIKPEQLSERIKAFKKQGIKTILIERQKDGTDRYSIYTNDTPELPEIKPIETKTISVWLIIARMFGALNLCVAVIFYIMLLTKGLNNYLVGIFNLILGLYLISLEAK